MISLDQATDRLLHHASYRQAFLEGRYQELELKEEDLAALQQLDRSQLVETALSVRRSLLERKHRGSGGIRAAYPITLQAWQQRFDDEDLTLFLDRFMESKAFDSYREIPHAGLGLSLEEACFRFFENQAIGTAAQREQEFLAGMCKALALNPKPAFLVGDPLRRVPAGWFAVSGHQPHSLFAALSGRYVQGALTPFLAELLTSQQRPATIAARHQVADTVLEAAVQRFTALGLLIQGP